MAGVLTYLGPHRLPLRPEADIAPGHWEEATCERWDDAMTAAGGPDELILLEWWCEGDPSNSSLYTVWGTPDRWCPVAAEFGLRALWPPAPCALEHAVYVQDAGA